MLRTSREGGESCGRTAAVLHDASPAGLVSRARSTGGSRDREAGDEETERAVDAQASAREPTNEPGHEPISLICTGGRFRPTVR
ncbi:hypothetical protein CDD83_2353 [Cordyceps sp. RAO-2017]|nr:hypothetical protein CDD83_2353 [Cordyceps sp. RAO-2017]